MNKLDIVKKACEDKLGKNLSVLDIQEKSTIADYFVIVTGDSIQQTKAISNEIKEKVEEAGFEVLGNEGFRDASWILMDLGDIIVHIFTKESREFYDIDKLWD